MRIDEAPSVEAYIEHQTARAEAEKASPERKLMNRLKSIRQRRNKAKSKVDKTMRRIRMSDKPSPSLVSRMEKYQKTLDRLQRYVDGLKAHLNSDAKAA